MMLLSLIVSDINGIDFVALKRAGINALVFDIDNTLSEPYQYAIHASIHVFCCWLALLMLRTHGSFA